MGPDTFRVQEPRGCDETIALAAGGSWNTCEVCRDGTGICWGGRAYGRLEDLRGPPPSSYVGGANPTAPERVRLLEHAVEVAAGPSHACALETTGEVVCWGENTDGQLGGGFAARERGLAKVEGIADAIRVDSTGEFACAQRRGGTVSCWGSNRGGQLGDGAWASRGEARAVPGLDSATSISVANAYGCATRSDGKLVCWGSNVPLTDDRLESTFLTPTVMAKVSDVVEVSASGAATCARTRKGRVECWGEGDLGALGNTPLAGAPTFVLGLDDAREVATGGLGGCAVRRSGKLVCWGAGSIAPWMPGPAGMRYPSRSLTKPREVTEVTDVISARVPGCLVRRSGRVLCWQADGAYLLPEATLPAHSEVPGLVDAVSVVRGGIVVRANGELAKIDTAQMGRWAAKPFMPQVRDAVDASADCAVLATGAVVCWGADDSYGQLGAGNRARSEAVVAVRGFR